MKPKFFILILRFCKRKSILKKIRMLYTVLIINALKLLIKKVYSVALVVLLNYVLIAKRLITIKLSVKLRKLWNTIEI